MTYIVNLSSIHTLHPISTNINAFAEICNRYSTSCSPCCPSFFQSWSNYAWVMYQYNKKYRELIEPYKLGRISTNEFLDNLVSIFDFLEDSDLDEESLIGDDWSYYSQNPVHRILEKAWSAGIDLDESTRYRLPRLAGLNEPIYLVSNTNELDVLRILALLKANNPEINFSKDIDLRVCEDKSPIEIAPNIYLCLSYRFQLFKTAGQNNSTMSLLRYLVEQVLRTNTDEIEVISQFGADLQEAERLGIPQINLHTAEEFFRPNLSEIAVY